MAGMNPFKVPKNQRYRYILRYWEPDKEELEERIRQASSATSDDPGDMKARIARGFQRRASYRGVSTSHIKRKSNLILLAIIIGLIYISYILIVKYLPQIEKALQ